MVVRALINKNTLAHICEAIGITTEFIVARTKYKSNQVDKWLDASDKALPTIKQAKCLSACLHIPFAGLYMNPADIPIKRLPNIKNMRTIQGSIVYDDSALNIAISDVLLGRNFLLETSSDFNVNIVPFSFSAPIKEEATIWADAIRKKMGIELQEQFKCNSNRKFYLYLREKIEGKGVFVNCFTDVPVEDVRGFAIYYSKLPIIGINDNDSSPAKSFTLIHETVHIIKRSSSVCNEMVNSFTTLREEVFCNAVAGELLVPKMALMDVLKKRCYVMPFTMEIIKSLANKFSVSKEVIVRRFLDLGLISHNDYSKFYDTFRKEREEELKSRQIAKEAGLNKPFSTNVARDTFDRISPSISKILFKGYVEDVYNKQDIARHLGISHKYIDKYLEEVSKWNR